MRKEIPFPYPFTGFGDLNFINCFASYYLYANGISDAGNNACAVKDGGKCDGCGGCNNNNLISGMQWFFETIAGNTSTRCPFAENVDFDIINRRNDPETIDFLLQFTGLDYTIEKDNLPLKSAKSIDNGWPVLARMKNTKPNGFRVVNGYGDSFDDIVTVGTDGKNGRPDGSPVWDEIAEIIVIKGKTEPKAGLIDAFQRIASVIAGNLKNGGVWDMCIQGFNFLGGVNVVIDELERRFKIMCDAAFYNFNSHFFAEQFRNPVYEPLKDPRLEDIRRRIDRSCDLAHMRNWQMVALYEFRGDWSKMNDNIKEWGYAASMLDCLKALKACDEEILAAINDAIEILSC